MFYKNIKQKYRNDSLNKEFYPWYQSDISFDSCFSDSNVHNMRHLICEDNNGRSR